jgi:(S)-ureidoglycine aminohydrolase
MKYFFFLITIFFSALSSKAQKTDPLAPEVYYWNKLESQKEETRVRRQVLEGSTNSLSYFEVHTSTLEPGRTPHPPHKHDDQEELMIVKEGTVKITIAGVSKILGPGSIAFAMPGDDHGIENAGNTAATYYILKYQGRIPDLNRGKQAGSSFMLDWNELKTKNTGKGYRRDFFNRATSQLNQFEMHTTALNADSVSHAPHTHVQEEIILMLRGNVTMHIDGKLYPAFPGDVVFLPSLVPHALLNTGKEQCEYFAFQWRN